MNCGPSAYQLGRVWKRVQFDWPATVETADPDGWYEDGRRDRQRGRPANYGACSLQVNQEAYLRGYQEADV